MKTAFPLFVFFSALIACGHENSPGKKPEFTSENQITPKPGEISNEKGRIIKNVLNKFDGSQSYCLFVPIKAETSTGYVILFFDPKGDGSIPVKKYQSVAEQHGWILAGSNNSKNGLKAEQSETIAGNFINDLSSRLKVDRQKIIVCGFSGGARVAVQTAAHQKLQGVIGCAAGFPFEPDRDYGFAFIGMVGNEDFNYLEMKRLHKKLNTIGIKNQVIVFDGEHEWPSAERMEIAMLCMEAIRENRVIADDKTLTELLAANAAKPLGTSDENENDQIEAKAQSEIAQAFSRQDFNWLQDKIRLLSSDGGRKSEEQKLMNKRLLNFISLMGFLYSEKALGINLQVANQYLGVYGKADFDNPDYHYLRACYLAKSGIKNEAVSEFKKSVQFGFTDFEKALNEASFGSLQGEPVFSKIIDSLKAIK